MIGVLKIAFCPLRNPSQNNFIPGADIRENQIAPYKLFRKTSIQLPNRSIQKSRGKVSDLRKRKFNLPVFKESLGNSSINLLPVPQGNTAAASGSLNCLDFYSSPRANPLRLLEVKIDSS